MSEMRKMGIYVANQEVTFKSSKKGTVGGYMVPFTFSLAHDGFPKGLKGGSFDQIANGPAPGPDV